MSTSINMTGQTHGRWEVLQRVRNAKSGQAQWLCRCSCGTERVVLGNNLRRGESISCGCAKIDARAKMRGEKHPMWKGGRRIENGYVVLTNADFPGSVFPNKTAEHIVVMAQHLGRPLYKGESVHHKNGVRDDNRLENLELWVKPQPTGVRLDDLITWAKTVLQTYEPTALSTT